MDLRLLVKEYLKNIQQMQIATSNADQSWISTVYFAYDENFDLFWLSRPERRHSIEIEKNPKVSGAIVKQHIYGEKVRGIQFQGIASRLSGTDAERGMEVYNGRYSTPRERVKNILSGENGEKHVVYKIKLSLLVLFDEVNFPQNPSQVIEF